MHVPCQLLVNNSKLNISITVGRPSTDQGQNLKFHYSQEAILLGNQSLNFALLKYANKLCNVYIVTHLIWCITRNVFHKLVRGEQ